MYAVRGVVLWDSWLINAGKTGRSSQELVAIGDSVWAFWRHFQTGQLGTTWNNRAYPAYPECWCEGLVCTSLQYFVLNDAFQLLVFILSYCVGSQSRSHPWVLESIRSQCLISNIVSAMHQDEEIQRVHFHFPFLMVFVFFFTSFLSSLLGCSRGACVPSSFLPWTLSRLWNACHDSQLFSGSRDIVQKLTALNMSLTHGGLPSTLPADVLAELKETAAKLCSPGTWTQHVSSVDSNCKPNITMQKMSSSWGAITYLSWNECLATCGIRNHAFLMIFASHGEGRIGSCWEKNQDTERWYTVESDRGVRRS